MGSGESLLVTSTALQVLENCILNVDVVQERLLAATGARFDQHDRVMDVGADWEIAAGTVTLRWSRGQIAVVKHAASFMGAPYQTYMKHVVFKQALADLQQAEAALTPRRSNVTLCLDLTVSSALLVRYPC